MATFSKTLKFGASSVAIATASLFGAPVYSQASMPALPPTATQAGSAPGTPLPTTAQSTLAADPAEASGADGDANTIVVTGTSIRGVAPVGSNLISVGRDEIAKIAAPNVTQLLQTVPALSNFGVSGRGGNGNGGNGASVYIHQIGASAQNSTLVLVDGHRLPPSGVTSSVVDPNNVPAVMLERVEVLAEGASSVYGSDAVAGVVNFITRRNYEGIEIKGQATHIRGTKPSLLGSIIAGHTWDTGSMIFGAQYSYEDELRNTDRGYTNPNQTARAAASGITNGLPLSQTNFNNFNCGPAGIRPNAAGTTIYVNNVALTTAASATKANNADAPCNQWAYGSLLPKEKRFNAMIKLRQEVTDTLELHADVVYSKRRSQSITSRGTITATAFGPGTGGTTRGSGTAAFVVQAGQVNPFYANPTGVNPAPAANAQEVRYDFNQLYGSPARTNNGDETIFGSVGATWKVTGDWEINALGVAGRAFSYFGETEGVVNTALATLYLNGTAQTAGNPTSNALPGAAGTVTTLLPLTTANALDVWNASGSNRTSAATLAALTDSNNLNRQNNSLEQGKLYASGTVFDLPAGPLKIAVGLEYIQTGILQTVTNRLAISGTSVASQFFRYKFGRHTWSQFAEANIPVINDEMNIPLVRKLDISAAIRHDKYNDFGNTTNPKASFTWELFEGLRVRGNASRSFVAPGLNINGKPFGNANFSGVSNATLGQVPLANYPTLASGIQAGGFQGLLASCNTTPQPASCNVGAIQGVAGNVGDPLNGPQKGKGWSVGVDFTPTFFRGFRANVTLWDTKFFGGITNPSAAITVATKSIADRITFYPNCATAADIAGKVGTQPVLANFPACISFINIGNNGNYLNFFVRGLDISVSQTVRTANLGTFVGGVDITKLLRFNQGFAARGQRPAADQIFSVKNTRGLNTTFPNVGTTMRGHLGWSTEAISADIYANYTGSYKNVLAPYNPIILGATGVYSGQGGDKVKAQTTIDTTIGYRFTPGFVGETQLTLRVRNLLNKKPPYFNQSTGYDDFVSNVLGRTIAFAVGVKL